MADKRKPRSQYSKTSNGYVKDYLPREGDTPPRVVEHDRLLMEQKLGRKLRYNETVHHRNGRRDDNDLDNLEVISRSENTAKSNKKRAGKKD